MYRTTRRPGYWRAPTPVYAPPMPLPKPQQDADKEYDLTQDLLRAGRAAPTGPLGTYRKVRKQGYVTFSAVPRSSMPPTGTQAFREYSKASAAAATMRMARVVRDKFQAEIDSD